MLSQLTKSNFAYFQPHFIRKPLTPFVRCEFHAIIQLVCNGFQESSCSIKQLLTRKVLDALNSNFHAKCTTLWR